MRWQYVVHVELYVYYLMCSCCACAVGFCGCSDKHYMEAGHLYSGTDLNQGVEYGGLGHEVLDNKNDSVL